MGYNSVADNTGLSLFI